MTTEQRDFWRKALIPEDYELTDKAITQLTQTQISRPTLADIRQLVKAYEFTYEQTRPETKCQTCGGDRFVLVSSLPEQYAACPDCNHADTSFRRYDGTMANAHDPAKVREMMRR